LLPYLLARASSGSFRYPPTLPASAAAAAGAAVDQQELQQLLFAPGTLETRPSLVAYARSSAVKTAASLLHALVQRGSPRAAPLVAEFAALARLPDSPSAATPTPAGPAAAMGANVMCDVQSEVDRNWRLAGQVSVAVSALGSPRFFALAAANFSPADTDFIRSAPNFLLSVTHFTPPPFVEHRYFATVAPALSRGLPAATAVVNGVTPPAQQQQASQQQQQQLAPGDDAPVAVALRQLGLTYLLLNTSLAAAAGALPTLLPRVVAALDAPWGALRLAAAAALARLLAAVPDSATAVGVGAGTTAAEAEILRRAMTKQRDETYAAVIAALTPLAAAAVEALCRLATAGGARAPAPARVSALHCLLQMAVRLAPAVTAPLRERVLAELAPALEDRKVAVRQATVRCRARWFLVPTMPK
jgi:hypothetical protein